MKSILFNNACVITARFLVSLDFLFPRFSARKKESQGSLLFLHCSVFKVLCCQATALILYHFRTPLSIPFQKFF
ncbi:MAG TPA: hypothetical protein DCZ62_02510 [Ruminococcus sp.]|nr:hypothetical protein [Ruminococcus sp.]